MTSEDRSATVAAMPGGWTLTVDKMSTPAPRYVARRTAVDGEETSDQFESGVFFEDLIERIHRRNVALGIERVARPEEVALSG